MNALVDITPLFLRCEDLRKGGVYSFEHNERGMPWKSTKEVSDN